MIRKLDTNVGLTDSDTTCLGVSTGQRVRLSVGLMEGLEAVVIRRLSTGHIVLQLQPGVYIEVLQHCLATLKKTRWAR